MSAAKERPVLDVGSVATSWTVVRAAGSSDPERAREALTTLAQRYRGPVRAYLLHSGRTELEADGLAAAFFERLAEASSLSSAAQGNTSFRVWLLEQLESFVAVPPEPPSPLQSTTRRSSAAPPAAPPVVPGYQALEPIGSGAEGTVYRAYDSRSQRHVALKVLHPEQQRQPQVVDRFRRSVALASTLDHPNIVRVYDRGADGDELAYCAMQLVPGGTLAEPSRQARFRDPARATRLVIKLARAVHHAHEHGILHRDLSPANVLLDTEDEPYVGDFMAKRVGQQGPGSVGGTIAYAAPEVALGGGGTLAADVYSLAAVLYELWTGNAPIRAHSFEEAEREHERELAAPRSVVPGISRELDAVCMAALNREPRARHASAASLADNLERALARLPPHWPKTPRRRRAVLWTVRHPFLAVSAVLGAALLLAADWFTLASVRKRHAEVEAATLHVNAALASAQARAVLTLFEKFATHAVRTALDPEVRAIAERGDIVTAPPVLQRVYERTRNFDSVGVFTTDARIIARYPEPDAGFLGREFGFRAYNQCIRAVVKKAEIGLRPAEPEVCVSPAYRGESSGQIEFTIAAPLYSDTGTYVGFVILNKHAKHTLEEIDIDDAYRSGQITAVFGQRGRDRLSAPTTDRSRLTAVAHPGLFSVEERTLDPLLSRKLIEHFGEQAPPGSQLRQLRVRPWEEADYVDPVTREPRLAGFAPVGNTGFVVGVSTPKEGAFGANDGHVDALFRYAAMLNLGFLILVGVALRASLRDGVPRQRS
jgi:tRNA A-37 threonylcarbamoyl transferase component Bud32